MHEKSSEEIAVESTEKVELGTLLRTRREAGGLSLETVAERTHIRRSYLQAFENGDYEQLPPLTYAIGFLRQYATLLGLDGEQAVQAYRQATQSASDVKQRQITSEIPCLKTGLDSKQRLRLYMWLAIGVVLIVAVCLQSQGMGIGSWFAAGEDAAAIESVAIEPAGGMVSEPLADPSDGLPAQTVSPLVQTAPTSAQTALPTTQDPGVLSVSNGEMPQTVNLALPDSGGVFRIESQGHGWVELEADRRPLQSYDMQPGTLVDGAVRDFAKIQVSIPGGSMIRLNDRQLALPDNCIVILGRQPEAKPLDAMVTLTAESRDVPSQP